MVLGVELCKACSLLYLILGTTLLTIVTIERLFSISQNLTSLNCIFEDFHPLSRVVDSPHPIAHSLGPVRHDGI